MASTGTYGNRAAKKQRAGQGPNRDQPLFVVFQTAGNPGLLRLVRGGPVVFTQYQAEMARANKAWLEEMRTAVLANIQSRILRPSVSTGRLEQVTASPDNYIFDQTNQTFGFSFGVPRFLNESQAKYWRTQEEGSKVVWRHPFVGTKLAGKWGETIVGFYENRWGTVPMAGAPFSRSGAGSGGKLRPVSTAWAQEHLKGKTLATVHREIRPMNAYADAWREHVTSQRFRDVWAKAFYGGVIPSRKLQLFDAPTPRHSR